MPGQSRQNRRAFLRTAAATGTAATLGGIAGCTGFLEDQSLTVAVYGGVFQDVLDDELFEPFNEEVDFEATSQEQPTAEEALAQYESAVDAGEAPVDVAIMSTVGVLRGLNSDLWHIWESEEEFENLQYISDDLIEEADGGIASVGALSWYINLVQNTEVIEESLDSWEALWDEEYEDTFGLLGLASNSFLLDITAEVYFDGQETLQDREGVEEVFEQLEGVTDQANFWYENEAEFQQRLRDGEVPAGMLYSDITKVMQDDGAPVQSNFVEEGSVLDSGSWVALETTELTEEARQFIDYASRPEVQDRVAESLYTAPTIDREHSEIDDETYEEIAGPGPEEAIVPHYELYLEEEEWVNERWEEFIIG
ncbi:putative spermidine/putrescine transport system substrate-binding protein [Halobiforma haloterrestris]|uniref:Putative spermidine/putrescine transport system substrate-binding protein n=1 Tax=Natronobacterium haloterrestre TaxID=148448 RepID=A0A1I1J273_NATHA|nr:extracellular solute-binding protein [Halobiforma haloterrestris]SFC42566.1 putative spermidine/putrescine transport system substrate-binding protein [Halobiforma haloterrestris]